MRVHVILCGDRRDNHLHSIWSSDAATRHFPCEEAADVAVSLLVETWILVDISELMF